MFNANNYGYNPYNRYMGQPMQQLEQSPVLGGQRPLLGGRPVDSETTGRMADYPLDGTVSYFPVVDGSAIITKQLGPNGVSNITVYKPVKDENTKTYLTDTDLDWVRKDIEDIKSELENMRSDKNE